MAQRADRRMSLDVMVNLIFLISSLVESFSDMTIFVPSDRTTFSRGEMRKAKGRLDGQRRRERKDSRHALDDEEREVCIWRDASLDTFEVVLGQTAVNVPFHMHLLT